MFYSTGLGSLRISQNSQVDVSAASADAREAKTETEFLRHDIDRLLMITEALWGFLKTEHGYSDEDLVKAITAIDMKDGRLDGKAAQPASVTCPGCGRPNMAKRTMCIYCGKPLPMAPFAR
ncbi:MAG TPA: hypothetical protein VH255_10250 [Verrucomicrobiae bacterium]|nr:hypothetical protein [Verrucomicrobiae bacterium]